MSQFDDLSSNFGIAMSSPSFSVMEKDSERMYVELREGSCVKGSLL